MKQSIKNMNSAGLFRLAVIIVWSIILYGVFLALWLLFADNAIPVPKTLVRPDTFNKQLLVLIFGLVPPLILTLLTILFLWRRAKGEGLRIWLIEHTHTIILGILFALVPIILIGIYKGFNGNLLHYRNLRFALLGAGFGSFIGAMMDVRSLEIAIAKQRLLARMKRRSEGTNQAHES